MPIQQLQMIWPEHRVACPPDPVAPPGYELRTYRADDEVDYLTLLRLAGFRPDPSTGVEGLLRFALPESCFVAVHSASGQLVATAVGRHFYHSLHQYGGEMGWVAGHPAHAGKGLGAAVCGAVTCRLLSMGFRRIFLLTDDHRLAALKTYLKLGYVPFLFAPDMPARWCQVCENLGWPFTPGEWPSNSDPTVPGEREDADQPNRYPWRRQWLADRPHRGYALMGDVDAFGDESLYHPTLLGVAEVSPSRLVAGQTMPLRLMYVAGPAGLAEGAQVTFVMRGQQPLGRAERDYELIGPEGRELAPHERGFGFRLLRGGLSGGEEVELRTEPFTWTPLAGRREFKVVVNAGDGSPERRLSEPLVIDILPGRLDHLDVTLPATRRANAPVVVQATTRDEFDNRTPVSGTLEARSAKSQQRAPMVSGLARCRLDVGQDAVVRAEVSLPNTGLSAVSNPCVETQDLQLYIGDLHCHDFLSEAEGYTDEVYRWAIEDRRLDFVSVVPQAHGWLDNETWTVAKYMNERYLREGQFVPFLGFEWQHSGYGDKVVHYLGGDQPYLPVDDRRYSSPAKLYAALRASDALVISHHPGYPIEEWVPGTDFEAVETDVERLVELWSMHGSSEGYDPFDRPLVGAADNGGVLAALRRGLRVGFVAGSDTHSARPGGSVREPRPYWGGLAAVWARKLTRRELFDALRARRTYALTGARIVLKMTANGAWMGEELPLVEHIDLRIDAWALGSIKLVEVMKDGRVWQRVSPDGDECHLELEDRISGPAFYHCRVTQVDGELAVCSPVWIG